MMLSRLLPSSTISLCLVVAVVILSCASPLFAQQPLSAEQIEQMLANGESLAGQNIAQADLAGMTFQGVSLADTEWTQTDLRGAEFIGVDLQDAKMAGINARGTVFRNCDLSGATLQDSDLAGASFTDVLLWGTTLQDVTLHGSYFEGIRLSPSGAWHLSALAAALQAVTARTTQSSASGHPLAAPEFVAGLSGDAFAFVYDPQDPGIWPSYPIEHNPLVAAGEVLGCEVATNFRLSQAVAFKKLREALSAGKVCLLPLRFSVPGSTGAGLQQPLWAAAIELAAGDDEALCRLVVPPFGEMELPAEQLDARWQQAQITLQPATAELGEVSYPLIVISPPADRISLQQTALWSIANAVEMLTATGADSETTLCPGLEGIQKLSGDLAAAQAGNEVSRLVQLAVWGGLPRLSYIGSRRAAADFLNRVTDSFPREQGDILAESAVLLRSEAAMLQTQWQPMIPGQLTGLTTKQAVQENLQVLAEVHAVEQQVLRNLEKVLGGTG